MSSSSQCSSQMDSTGDVDTIGNTSMVASEVALLLKFNCCFVGLRVLTGQIQMLICVLGLPVEKGGDGVILFISE